jgi:23S rRNA (cytosine1962-C5)-methyltransferase
MSDSYALLDSGNEQKLEQFGPYRLVRPALHAIWKPALPQSEWKRADGVFTREGSSRWLRKVEGEWRVEISGVKFKLLLTDFGHLGVFPEHQEIWNWSRNLIRPGESVLNLFAYSGGATLACAKSGAEVCHVDASKGMVNWARENAALNGLQDAPIRWIVDDARKFLKREAARGRRYDGIILDPPTFGRGSQGQVFKIEVDLPLILDLCRQLKPRFIALSCHTAAFSPLVLSRLLADYFPKGKREEGEMLLRGPEHCLPTGTFARWIRD